MSAKIKTLIDKHDTFEIVRDEIAAILLLEITNQKTLAITAGKDPDLWDFNIYVERSNTWEILESDEGEIESQVPLINVFFDQFTPQDSGSNPVETTKMIGQFNIDCYAGKNSKRIQDQTIIAGDELAARDTQRILKLVRNILMAGTYTYLGQRGLVVSRKMSSAQMYQPNITDSPSLNFTMARANMTVVYYEFSPQVEPIDLDLVQYQCLRSDSGLLYFDSDFDY